jgi:predicted DNA-binding transcriptional regulator AlpA
MSPDTSLKRYIRIKALCARYDRSHMWVERKLASDPTFPRPIKFGGRWRMWDVDELAAWERKTAAREARAA